MKKYSFACYLKAYRLEPWATNEQLLKLLVIGRFCVYLIKANGLLSSTIKKLFDGSPNARGKRAWLQMGCKITS